MSKTTVEAFRRGNFYLELVDNGETLFHIEKEDKRITLDEQEFRNVYLILKRHIKDDKKHTN